VLFRPHCMLVSEKNCMKVHKNQLPLWAMVHIWCPPIQATAPHAGLVLEPVRVPAQPAQHPRPLDHRGRGGNGLLCLSWGRHVRARHLTPQSGSTVSFVRGQAGPTPALVREAIGLVAATTQAGVWGRVGHRATRGSRGPLHCVQSYS